MTFILACLTATFEGFLKRKKHKCLERRQHDPGEPEAVKGGAKGRGGGSFGRERCQREEQGSILLHSQ